MKEKIVAIILIYLSKETLSQYDGSYGVQQGYQYNPYQNMPYQSYPDQLLQNNKWNEEENANYKDYKDYNDYDENICDCTKCGDLKPGCLNACPNCVSTPQPLMPQNYFILPFPYPYPMTAKETAPPVHKETQRTTTTTIATTTTATTTTTTESTTTNTEATETVSEATTETSMETDMTMSPFHVISKRPYLITSLRKTKPNWMPKYGIVPISDTFAEKIMLQLRDMKVLHPRRDVARKEAMYPLQ
ncbi:hypothetical protein KGM_207848 [Danaus plexippus plexippus]|uniref:Uncharacterized protein n=1 Tax=Danaus plexippus plexippus TaxID=278856 RepID=A0A212FHW8_DANPL|nr:hypothetical protein KGM_207848 [Danaus plexippus plexippus]